MEPARWLKIEELFHAALDCDPGERQLYLDKACAADSELRQEVEELLRDHDATWSFFDKQALKMKWGLFNFDGECRDRVELHKGQAVGAYRIIGTLGIGGMGEVYRAHDTRLDRDVAIKMLFSEFAHDYGRLRRFELEARVTSALNHPNILTVYDIGEHEGAPFIVAELLEGEDLRAVLEKGPLPIKKAVDYCTQIAAGLAAAHDRGIIHRDLKPGNLFITADGRVKILDFGLAKLRPRRTPRNKSSDTPPSDRRQEPLTQPGIVMGTVGYMSPEQVRGEEADQRSDIFAFGIILYEMLSGNRPFGGESMVEVMNAILKDDPPDLSGIMDSVSPQLSQIIRHCLEKVPEKRFQSAHDLGFALNALSFSRSASHPTEVHQTRPARNTLNYLSRIVHWRERLAWISLGIALIFAAGFARAYFANQSVDGAGLLMKLEITPPANANFNSFAISPDGRWLAFTGWTDGKLQLWVRALDSTEARVLPGTEGARDPFWSPDSQSLAFFSKRALKKISVSGGPPQTLCYALNSAGGAWNRDGTIIFSVISGGMYRVSALGGNATTLTVIDHANRELNHYFPSFLPDGRHFLYTILSSNKERQGIYIGSLDDKLKQRLLPDESSALYASPGFVLFGRGDALLAQSIDTARLQLSGEAVTIAEQIRHDPVQLLHKKVSVSENGILVVDSIVNRVKKRLAWIDRAGNQLNSIDNWWPYTRAALSPDEKHFVADRLDRTTGTYDLWVAELSGANAKRFTFDSENPRHPIWSPDGKRIIWTANSREGLRIYQKSANGEGDEQPLTDIIGVATDISPDGRFIVFEQGYPIPTDIWIRPLAEGQQAYPLIKRDSVQSQGCISPDGRWVAYVSFESGDYEIFVQRFPEGGSKLQVSKNGGGGPQWRRDGRELFYYSMGGKLIAIPVKSGDNLEMGPEHILFEFQTGGLNPVTRPFVATRDGQRFLVLSIVDSDPRAPLTVEINWTAGLKK